MLSVNSSDLYEIFIGNGLVEVFVLHQFWKVDVDGGSKTSSHIGWASGNVTEVVITSEFSLGLDFVGSIGESLEYLKDVRSLLHGNDSKLILFVNPHKEGLGVVVEDTTRLWPVSLKTSGLKILVSTLEEEVVSNKLLFLTFAHGGKAVIFTLKISGELVQSGHDKGLNLLSILSGNGGSKRVGSHVSSNSDSCGVDHLVLISWEWWAVKLGVVHGANVLVTGLMSVVMFNDLIHEWGEGIVRIVRSSIHTNSRVSPLRSGHDGLSESKSEFVSPVFALFPHISGEALRKEGLSSSWEIRESLDFFWIIQVRSDHGSVAFSDRRSILSSHCFFRL